MPLKLLETIINSKVETIVEDCEDAVDESHKKFVNNLKVILPILPPELKVVALELENLYIQKTRLVVNTAYKSFLEDASVVINKIKSA
ncbi:hypothetical protein [Paenibacillus thermotolerans]|uniref:hypothetical protein n=1 Tax=Paenibacillus thermotolerans TaxID=3027807 RepID=UPI0023675AE1|nr:MULTISPECIES: hypothetical protein [unclassified Paenibacillus]